MSGEWQGETGVVRAGVGVAAEHGDVMPPLHLSSNYTFEGPGCPRTYDYTRSGNPTRGILGDALARAEGGAGGVVTSSGMAAVAVAVQLCSPGGLILAPADCYGGTHRLLEGWAARGVFRVEWLDFQDPRAVDRALEEGPDLLWIESPSNPLLRVVPIRELARAAHGVGALVLVDNTFLSPALQRPLELGADIVLHSTTKYINGHSDVVGGAVIAVEQSVGEQLAWWANCIGVTASAFDSWLTLRGLRTLSARLAVHQHNAARLVALLQRHPAVERVHYPGLPGHPGHLLARRQQDGFGAMVSFELKGGEPAVRRLLEGLECFSLAESLGGVESLIAHPSTMTHAAMPAEDRARAGIGEDLLRLSVGLEAASDLVADLSAGLDRALALPGGRAPGVEKRHVRR